MAAARGLPSVFLSAASCVRWHTPCSLRTRLCPLLIQTRQRTNKRTRFKAPHEPKQKDKWSKAMREKAVSVKDKKPTLSLAFLSRVPVDDVWIRAHYPRPQFSLEESLVRHKEFADPSMLDNMEGLVYADMELNMKTAKKTKFLPNIKGTILLPHPFQQTRNQKIAIFCKTEEDKQKAKSLGAAFVGCEDLVKEVLEGLVDKDEIDVVLCTPDAITELIPIRSQLRDKFPSKAKGSVSSSLDEMWMLYTQGVAYSSEKLSEAVGKLQVPLGPLKMPVEQLMDNFHAYVDAISKGRTKPLGPLITQIFVVAPPSTEKFLLQLENCVPGYEKSEGKQEEDSDSDDEDAEEEKASGKR